MENEASGTHHQDGPPYAPCRSRSGPRAGHAGYAVRIAAAPLAADTTAPRPSPPPRQGPRRSAGRPRPGGDRRTSSVPTSSSRHPANPATFRACGRRRRATPAVAEPARASQRRRRHRGVAAAAAHPPPQFGDFGPQLLNRPPKLGDHLTPGGAYRAPGGGRRAAAAR